MPSTESRPWPSSAESYLFCRMNWNEASTGSSLTVQRRAGVRAGTHHIPPHQDCLAGSVRLGAAPTPPERHRVGCHGAGFTP